MKSTYNLILKPPSGFDETNRNFLWIWKLNCHNRYKFFIWTIMSSGLPCKTTLAKRGLINQGDCPLCLQFDESLDHQFRSYRYVLEVWSQAKAKGSFSSFQIKLSLIGSQATIQTLFPQFIFSGVFGQLETRRFLKTFILPLRVFFILQRPDLLNFSSWPFLNRKLRTQSSL